MKLIDILKEMWHALYILCYRLCAVFPIQQNKIFVVNYYGRGYGDNAKYIVEALLKQNKDYQIVWSLKNTDEKLPEGVKKVKSNSLKAIFHEATSKVWIDNCRKSELVRKRKDQFYIQTWHGGGAQKKCELDVIDKLAEGYVKNATHDSQIIDLMISESRFMTDLYHRSFWYNGPVYECGYPRYDILLKHDEELIAKVHSYFGIDSDKELVLYAPTFRVDCSFRAYNIDFDRLRANLDKRFNKEHVILVHLHPNVANVEGGISYDGTTVINSTFYPDTQELIAASSILIGDYSSINYDFSLQHKPVFRYVSDLEEYRNDRDLYFSFDEYPHPYAQSNDELEQLILNFDAEDYLKTLNGFFDKLGSVIQEGASERIADLVSDYMDSENKKDFFDRNHSRFIS